MGIREDAFLGKPVSAFVVDAHTHLQSSSYNGWYQAIRRDDEVIALMDRLGIDCIVTAPHSMIPGDMEFTNRCTEESAAAHPGRIYGYIFICPQRGIGAVKAAIEEYSKNPGFVGFKFLPGYHGPLACPEYDYALDFAAEAGCPVLCHIWCGSPSFGDVERAAKTRPALKLMMAHQGGGNPAQTDAYTALMKDYPNLYMEICGSLYNQYSMEDYLALAGEDRVIFGTDQINLDPRFDLGQVIFSTLSDEVKKKILAENFLRLLEGSSLGHIADG
jgi:predicted TIM-barrel fold metal-dependent hydrolase